MIIELNDRQVELIRFAVANAGCKSKCDAARSKSQKNLRQAAKDERLANEFLAVESYIHAIMKKNS